MSKPNVPPPAPHFMNCNFILGDKLPRGLFRDLAAIAAMQGMIRDEGTYAVDRASEYARASYMLADALLRAREES